MDFIPYVSPFYSPPNDPGTYLDQATDRHLSAETRDILIVEDEQALCDLLADVLEGEGHSVRKASNGLDALQVVRAGKPDLIFLDLMMPVMDGWQFLTELRQMPGGADIPVVVMTAVYDMSNLERKTGARAILSKPFDIELIIEAVKLFAA